MSLTAYILKNRRIDCTNGGISGKSDDDLSCTTDPTEKSADLLILIGDNGQNLLVKEGHNTAPHYYKAVPMEMVKSFGLLTRIVVMSKRVMNGGNFLYTSDSRFPVDHPIAIHDRTE